MMTRIVDFLKKYKWICLGVLAAAIVLTVAFIRGGSLNPPDASFVTLPDVTVTAAASNTDAAATAAVSAAQPTQGAASQGTTAPRTSAATTAPATTSAPTNSSAVIVRTENAPSNSSAPSEQSAEPETKAQDRYQTDQVPSDKPQPVEPQEQTVKPVAHTCTFSVSCASALAQKEQLSEEAAAVIPADGVILQTVTVTFNEGESVFDVLARVCRENRIHMEYTNTPVYNSAYIEGIGNLYEFDCGAGSGWMYRVNGWFPNYGCSRYALSDGDRIEWLYTCNLGRDIGGDYSQQKSE